MERERDRRYVGAPPARNASVESGGRQHKTQRGRERHDLVNWCSLLLHNKMTNTTGAGSFIYIGP